MRVRITTGWPQIPGIGDVRIHQPIEPLITARPWATETQIQQLESMKVLLKALYWSIIVKCLQAFGSFMQLKYLSHSECPASTGHMFSYVAVSRMKLCLLCYMEAVQI